MCISQLMLVHRDAMLPSSDVVRPRNAVGHAMDKYPFLFMTLAGKVS